VSTVVRISDAVVRRGDSLLLDRVSLHVREGERWIVMGPNGAGKTTLLLLAAARLFPTSGEVEVLDEVVGAVDLAEVRPRIGWASSALVGEIPPSESVRDVVMTGAWAVTGRWREEYGDADEQRTSDLLDHWGLRGLAGRTFGTLSDGERKRTLIARALMSDPEILLLDEPAAGLDLGGREQLVRRLGDMASDPTAPTTVLVTHHVEEIPPGMTHALLLRGGTAVAQGPVSDVLTNEALSATYATPLEITRRDGRWAARAIP